MGSQRRNRIIMGTALSLAALAVAIDHTRHALPEAAPKVKDDISYEELIRNGAKGEEPVDSSPCGLDGGSPCAL